MINIVVTSKPVDGLFLYSYEYCDLLNKAGILARVVVVCHRNYKPKDYLRVIESKYIHCQHITFDDDYEDNIFTMVMGRSMITQAWRNWKDYREEQQFTLRDLFSRKLVSVYSENHPTQYPLALEFFNPDKVVDLCDHDVYPNGEGIHFEKRINFSIYKPFKENVQFEYLFLGTNERYYKTASLFLPEYQDHGIITYDADWVNPNFNNIFVPVDDFLGIFNTYVYTKDHVDPAPRIIQECKRYNKKLIYERELDVVDGGSVYWERDIEEPQIDPILKAIKKMMKIQPRCLSFLFSESSPYNDISKGAAYTSDGYMLPCCWLDDPPVYRYIKACGLKDPELAVANNKCLEDIYTSEQWENFFQTLLYQPDLAPYMCKKKCGFDVDTDELKKEEKYEVEYQLNETNN